jgi:hypothetical protein
MTAHAAAAMRAAPEGAVPFWALMAFTFILLLAPQTLFPALAPLRVALVTAAAAGLAFLIERFVHRRPFVELTRETLLVVLLLGWAVVTLPLSYWPGGSVAFLLGTYLKTLIVFWLLSHAVNTPARLRTAAWGLSLMTVPIAMSGVMHLASGQFVERGLAAHESRILGYDAALTGNPNDLALTLNLILPLTVGLFLASRRPGAGAVLLACIALEVMGVIATFSRGGFLTLAVTFVLYQRALFPRPAQRHWAALALVLALVALPFLPEGFTERMSTITDIESDASGSAQARWSDTLAALEYVAFHPVVGAGIGMDALALNEMRGELWKEIHNVYLQYAIDLGLPGLVLFVLLLRGALKCAGEAQRRAQTDPARGELFHLAEGIRISLIAFAVAALFHPVAYHFYFYYFAGLALAVRSISATADR